MNHPTYRTLSGEHLAVVPWKNGAGLTTEIACGEARSVDHDWAWRVSIAEVGASGPFSTFPGISRTICVIEGDGMDLRFDDGSTLALDPEQPVHFDGGANAVGSLRERPVRNFNVMVDRSVLQATLDIVHGATERSLKNHLGELLLIHMLDGHCDVTNADQTTDTLRTNATIIVEGKSAISVNFASASRAAIVHLKALPSSTAQG